MPPKISTDPTVSDAQKAGVIPPQVFSNPPNTPKPMPIGQSVPLANSHSAHSFTVEKLENQKKDNCEFYENPNQHNQQMKSSNMSNPNLQKQPPNLNNPKGGSIPHTPNLSNPSKNLTGYGHQSSGLGLPASSLNYGPVLPTATNNIFESNKGKNLSTVSAQNQKSTTDLKLDPKNQSKSLLDNPFAPVKTSSPNQPHNDQHQNKGFNLKPVQSIPYSLFGSNTPNSLFGSNISNTQLTKSQLPKQTLNQEKTTQQTKQQISQQKTFKSANFMSDSNSSFSSRSSLVLENKKNFEQHKQKKETQFLQNQETNFFKSKPQTKKEYVEQTKPEKKQASFSTIQGAIVSKGPILSKPGESALNTINSVELIDLDEYQLQEQSVYLDSIQQAKYIKTYIKPQEKHKAVPKNATSLRSEERRSHEDMKLRVNELESLNQNYLKIIGELTETVKNLSIELLQKGKVNPVMKKTQEQKKKVEEKEAKQYKEPHDEWLLDV